MCYEFLGTDGHGKKIPDELLDDNTISISDHDGHTDYIRPLGNKNDAIEDYFIAWQESNYTIDFSPKITKLSDRHYKIEKDSDSN